MEDVNESSRTELDSHANMPVIGRNAYILSKIGETVDVAPFTPDYKPISVELVDAALKYECPYSGEVKILIIRRGLHVPSMTHNLLPPFMLREAGIQMNDVPKIHVTSPSEEHHAIIFQETNFRIPLTLHGTSSYFPTSKPTTQELEEPEDVYVLTPTTWNPHSDAYVINEESMLDWEGNMKHERDHEKRVVLEDIPSDDTMISSLALCEKEQMAVSSYFVDQDEDINAPYGFEDEHQLYHALNMRNEHGQFAMSIGATSILDQPYLDDDDDSQDSSEEDDILHDDSDDEFDLKELDDDTNEALIDNFMASTAQAGKTRGVDPKHLAKIWRISHEDAQRTIDVTTQTSTRTDDPTLSRNYSTNDRMLRYKRIKDYFFMDTFFATKKGGQSSRGHTCCQLFVTDKGFIYVVPMKKKSEVLLAIKQFAKEIGAPDSFVADMSGEQMSSEVKKFCNDIGTTLRALEEGTPWSNKAELYIGLKRKLSGKTCANRILHCVCGITVLRGEPGSITLQLRMHSSSMDPLPTQSPLVMKVTFPTCVSMDGMNGVTSGITLQHSPATRKFWEEYLALPEELVMRWLNGYSRRMAELSLEDPSDPSKLMRFTVLLKSRKEKYLMNSLRGDGEHQ